MIETAPPPYYPTKDAVQSKRVVQNFEQNARGPEHHRYTKARRSDEVERRVHFAPKRQHQHLIERHRDPSPRSILVNTATDAYPTVYIVTFATDYTRNTPRNVERLVRSQIPQRSVPIPHLCKPPLHTHLPYPSDKQANRLVNGTDTIDATSYPPPHIPLCEKYSGISPLIQEVVLRDSRVRGVVRGAVHDLVSFVYLDDTNTDKTRRERGQVCMSICCHAGTHRSVAIGERIAQGVKEEVGLKGEGRGVKVVVRHVSRVKGVGDPF
jgi:hypothetical protein